MSEPRKPIDLPEGRVTSILKEVGPGKISSSVAEKELCRVCLGKREIQVRDAFNHENVMAPCPVCQ